MRSFVYIFGNKISDKIPGSLQAARLDFSKNRNGEPTKDASVMLKTTAKDLRLNNVSSSDNSSLQIVNRLNDFIKEPHANNIKVEQDYRYTAVISVFFLGMPGLVLFSICLLIPVKVSCKFDRYLDRAFIDKKYLMYSKHQEISPLSKIKEVELREAYGCRSSGYDEGEDEMYVNIITILKNGKKQSISLSSSEFGWYEETAEIIKKFLAIDEPEIKIHPTKPDNSKIVLVKDTNFLEIRIPPAGFNIGVVCMVGFTTIWCSFFWSIIGGKINWLMDLPFLCAGVWFIYQILFGLFGRTYLRIDQDRISIGYNLFGFKYYLPRPASRQQISKVARIGNKHSRSHVMPQIIIWAGNKKFIIGSSMVSMLSILSETELDWLANELGEWLDLSVIEEKRNFF